MHRFKLLLLPLAASISILQLTAQDNRFDTVAIKATPVAGNVTMLEGSGGNIGLSVGDDGVLLIDDQFAPLTSKIVAAIGKLTDRPIRYVINTHLHGDHTGGNENLARLGVVLVAHDLVRSRLLNQTMNRSTGQYGPGGPVGGLPTVTFNDRITFHFNGEEIQVIKVPNAHTDGDSIVYFAESNVIHTGDVFRTTTYTVVDTNHGGSFQGTLQALNMILQTGDEETIIVPGHGVVSTKKDVREWRDMLAVIGRRIQASINAGNTLEQTLARQPGKEFDERWGTGSGFASAEVFFTTIYQELSRP